MNEDDLGIGELCDFSFLTKIAYVNYKLAPAESIFKKYRATSWPVRAQVGPLEPQVGPLEPQVGLLQPRVGPLESRFSLL